MKTKIYLCALAALFMIPQAMTAQTKKKAKKEVAIHKFCLHIVPDNCPKKNWLPVTCQSLFNGGISVLPIIKLQE